MPAEEVSQPNPQYALKYLLMEWVGPVFSDGDNLGTTAVSALFVTDPFADHVCGKLETTAVWAFFVADPIVANVCRGYLNVF